MSSTKYKKDTKHKNMKQKFNHLSQLFGRVSARATVVAILAVVVAASIIVPVVRADEYDVKIQALNEANNSASATAGQLQAQADSYQAVINQLQTQIDAVLAEIAAGQARQADLEKQITEKQAQLDQQRAMLGQDVKAMYVDGEMSAIEMLATSKNLSEYVDKEEYRNAVQKKIQESLTKIAKLQSELKQQKTEVDQLVANRTAQQAQLAASRAQQASMLAYTQAQKDAYTAQIVSNNRQIDDLKKQQIIANTRYNIGPAGTGVNCGGGYPAKWCEIGQDTVIDSWGMYNRECVSYTAFKVHQDFLLGKNKRDMPYWGGIGNANQWDDNARAAGIPVDTNPTVGSIAISNAGYYGHAMYVEHVYGDGTILVSQYNANWDGRYNTARKYTTDLVFLHF